MNQAVINILQEISDLMSELVEELNTRCCIEDYIDDDEDEEV